jgi:hypothetical protein
MHDTGDPHSDRDGVRVERANQFGDDLEDIARATFRSAGFRPLEYAVTFVDRTDLDVGAANIDPDDNQS